MPGVTVNVAGMLCDKLPLVPTMLNEYVLAATELATAIDSVEDPEPLTGLGLKFVLAPLGNPVVLKVTLPLKPLIGLTMTL